MVETTHAFVKLKQIKAAVSAGGITFWIFRRGRWQRSAFSEAAPLTSSRRRPTCPALAKRLTQCPAPPHASSGGSAPYATQYHARTQG